MNNDDIKKRLAGNVRFLRFQKRFSQEAIAALAGIGQNQVSEIENEHSNPSLDTIVKLANALNVDVSELFRRQD